MILPYSQTGVLLLLILCVLCLGSWASTLKLHGGHWRFELYYFDFALGALVCATLAALTLGSLGSELSFIDNVSITGKRQIAFGLVAGGIFNLANMLLVASVSIAGMAAPFLMALGIGFVIASAAGAVVGAQADRPGLLAGVVLLLAAVVATAVAYAAHTRFSVGAAGNKPKSPVKGIVFSLAAGILSPAFVPVMNLAREGELGLGPYTLLFFFTIGIFVSTFVYNIYFMNLPVEGRALEMRDYFRIRGVQHLAGILGGIVWAAGATAGLVAMSAPTPPPGPWPAGWAWVLASALVAALWGLLRWKEFADATTRTKLVLGLGLVLWLAGLALAGFTSSGAG